MIETVPLDKIRPGRNVRHHIGDVTALADTIRDVGLLAPLIVTRAADGHFDLVAGYRRHAACVLLRLDEVTVDVREFDDVEVLVAQLVENVQRADLGPLEEAHAFARLIGELGVSQRGVARRCGVSQANVSKKLSLLTLPAVDQARIEAGTLDVEAALKLVGRRRQPTDDSAESPVPGPDSEERGRPPRSARPTRARVRASSRRYAGSLRTEAGVHAHQNAARARRAALEQLADAHPTEYRRLLETTNRGLSR